MSDPGTDYTAQGSKTCRETGEYESGEWGGGEGGRGGGGRVGPDVGYIVYEMK